MGLDSNINRIREQITQACKRANRNTGDVVLVCVTKGIDALRIKQAIDSGITDIGENRVQQAIVKYNQLKAYNSGLKKAIKWHMIGHLQTNKVKDAVRIFDLIHSVDSLHLAFEIDKLAGKINKVQDILIQVNTSGESTKYGLSFDKAIGVVKEIAKLKNINLTGLMTIAPIAGNPENARPYFRALRELRDKINNLRLMTHNLELLSMGMTDDYRIAIEEGSNMIRLGRAIFEDRVND